MFDWFSAFVTYVGFWKLTALTVSAFFVALALVTLKIRLELERLQIEQRSAKQ